MSRRPSFTDLVDWLEGRLPEDRAAEVAARVSEGDPELADAVDWIRGFHRDSGVLPLQPVPGEVSGRLHALFRDREQPWDPTGYLEPDAVHDSRDLPLASGFRTAGTAGALEARRVVVERSEVRLVIEITEHDHDGIEVAGSVRHTAPNPHRAPQPARVTFTSSGRVARRITCASDGTFHAALVPDDVDEVWVDAGEDGRFRAEVTLTLR